MEFGDNATVDFVGTSYYSYMIGCRISNFWKYFIKELIVMISIMY